MQPQRPYYPGQPPGPGPIVCKYCRHVGHVIDQCPIAVRCRACGQSGHSDSKCPQVQCQHCRQQGHTGSQCPYARYYLGQQYDPQRSPQLQYSTYTSICTQCGKSDHRSQNCSQYSGYSWPCQQHSGCAPTSSQIPSQPQTSVANYGNYEQPDLSVQNRTQISHHTRDSSFRNFSREQLDPSQRPPDQSHYTIIQCQVYQQIGDTYNYSVVPSSEYCQGANSHQTGPSNQNHPLQSVRAPRCYYCQNDHATQDCPFNHQLNNQGNIGQPDIYQHHTPNTQNGQRNFQPQKDVASGQSGQTAQYNQQVNQSYCDSSQKHGDSSQDCPEIGQWSDQCDVNQNGQVPTPNCQQQEDVPLDYSQTSQQSSEEGATEAAVVGNEDGQPQTQQHPENFWRDCVRDWFPRLHNETYFVPPFHFNKVPYDTEKLAGMQVLVPVSPHNPSSQPPAKRTKLWHNTTITSSHCNSNSSINNSNGSQSNSNDNISILDLTPGCVFLDTSPEALEPPKVQQTDIVDDRCRHKVLTSLKTFADSRNPSEAMIILSQLNFGNYLNKQCFAAANARLPRPDDLGPGYEQGDFDVLIIHREYGLIVWEMKSVGANMKIIRNLADAVAMRVRKTIKQLNKAGLVLGHLASDLAPVCVTKTLVLPYVSSSQLTQALTTDPALGSDLCQCLGASDIATAVRRCLCKDQLSDVTELAQWWSTLQPDPNMTPEIYERLVARLCGPATTIEVATWTQPRLQVRSIGQGIAAVGWMISQLTLYPEQVDLIQNADPLVYLTGPPGTGKTIMLVLIGLYWMSQGHDVYVISTNRASRAVSFLIKEQLERSYQHQQQSISGGASTSQTIARPQAHRHHFSFDDSKKWKANVKAAMSFLTGRSVCGPVHVIVDEAGCPSRPGCGRRFSEFCEALLPGTVRGLRLWAASVCDDNIPGCLQKKELTVPLRCPPVVIEAIKGSRHLHKDPYSTESKYTSRSTPAPTDGPEIIHHTHHKAHGAVDLKQCFQCGISIVGELARLGVLDKGDLQYRDVMILCESPKNSTSLLRGLREENVPFLVVKYEDNDDNFRRMALAEENEVIVTDWELASGLERRVVVGMGGLEDGAYLRAYGMSRCTSQLIWISNNLKIDLANKVDQPKAVHSQKLEIKNRWRQITLMTKAVF